MDELVKALMGRYPKAVLQFEDFNMEHAAPLLERYRDHHLCFNDDIQVPSCLQLCCETMYIQRSCHTQYDSVISCTASVFTDLHMKRDCSDRPLIRLFRAGAAGKKMA